MARVYHHRNSTKRMHTNPGLIPEIQPKEHATNTMSSMHLKSHPLSTCAYSMFLTINPYSKNKKSNKKTFSFGGISGINPGFECMRLV